MWASYARSRALGPWRPSWEATQLHVPAPGSRLLRTPAPSSRYWPGSRAFPGPLPSAQAAPPGGGVGGAHTPRGTGALGAEGRRAPPLSLPGIRWDRISPNPASAEGCGGERPDGGWGSRTLSPGEGGWKGGGCQSHCQGQLPSAESSQLQACLRFGRKWSSLFKNRKGTNYRNNGVSRCG